MVMIILSSVPSQARRSVPLPEGGSISYSSMDGKTWFGIRDRKGRRYVLKVNRDSTVSFKAEPSNLKVVGSNRGSFIIVVDTYPSVRGGMSYCQAGEERFLRVISMSKKSATEAFRIKVESCRENIILASPGIEWFPKISTLRINWFLGPSSSQRPEVQEIKIRPDGKSE